MRKVFIIFALLLSGCGQPESSERELSGFIASPFYKDNSPTKVLEKIYRFSENKEYEEIYSLLSPWYKSLMTEEKFIEISEENSWSLTKLFVGSVYENFDGAYAPVQISGYDRETNYSKFSVVFMVKWQGEWVLDNFPFSGHYLPERLLSSNALNKGIYFDVPIPGK